MTCAEMARRRRPWSGSLLSVTEPRRLSRAMRPASASRSVDLPDPLAPMTASSSPTRAAPETPSSSVLVRLDYPDDDVGGGGGVSADATGRRPADDGRRPPTPPPLLRLLTL